MVQRVPRQTCRRPPLTLPFWRVKLTRCVFPSRLQRGGFWRHIIIDEHREKSLFKFGQVVNPVADLKRAAPSRPQGQGNQLLLNVGPLVTRAGPTATATTTLSTRGAETLTHF